MRRWIGFGIAAVALCGSTWYFGRPSPAPVPATTPVASVPVPAVAPVEPPKVVDVINLARAYEPVREPEPVLVGGVDPATFIEERDAPGRIPPAFEEDNPYADLIRTVQESGGSFFSDRLELIPRVVPNPGPIGTESGPFQNLLHIPELPYPVRLDAEPSKVNTLLKQIVELYSYVGFGPVWLGDLAIPHGWAVEPLKVMPREVATIQDGLLNFVPTSGESGGLVLIPMGVPFKVMPPEVAAIQNGLLNFVSTSGESGGLVFIPMGVPYSAAAQPMPSNDSVRVHVEQLKVVPRVVPSSMIQSEGLLRYERLKGIIGP